MVGRLIVGQQESQTAMDQSWLKHPGLFALLCDRDLGPSTRSKKVNSGLSIAIQ